MKKQVVTRNADGLRQVLFDVIDGVRNGKMDLKTATAITKANSGILHNVKLELENRKFLASLATTKRAKSKAANATLLLKK